MGEFTLLANSRFNRIEKCHEKYVLIESFGVKTSDRDCSDDDDYGIEIAEKCDFNKNNVIIQHYNDNDENIILCWESYARSLPDLVRSLHAYDRNMIEYYR